MAANYFTRDEVVVHDSWYDIWVIVNGRVFDLTNLIGKRINGLNDNLCLLIQLAGKDLSRYFDEFNEPLYRVNQYLKNVPVFPPAFEKESDEFDFWWRGDTFVIGKITCVERRVRIINTLTRKIVSLNVCEEDSIETIKKKYKKIFNSNADCYVWRKTHSGHPKTGHLLMDNTLTQNNIPFEKHEKLGLPPALWLFYVLNKD